MHSPLITVNPGYPSLDIVQNAVHIIVATYVNELGNYYTRTQLQGFATRFFNELIKDVNSTEGSEFTVTTSYQGFHKSLPTHKLIPMELIAKSFNLQKRSDGVITIELGNVIRQFTIGCHEPAHYFNPYGAEKATLAIIAECSKILSDQHIEYDHKKMTTFRNYLVNSLQRLNEGVPYKFYPNRNAFLKIFPQEPKEPIFLGHIRCEKMVNGIRVTHIFRQ